jgi:hypothetical protein
MIDSSMPGIIEHVQFTRSPALWQHIFEHVHLISAGTVEA